MYLRLDTTKIVKIPIIFYLMHGDMFRLCLQPKHVKPYGILYRTRTICTYSVIQVGLKMDVSTAETCRHALNKI